MADRRLSVTMVSRFGYPCVGGLEAVIRTLATELSGDHQITCLAQRVDDDGIDWKNRIDQVPPWRPRLDPVSGVETAWFGLSPARFRAMAPLVRSPRRFEHFRAYQVYLELLERYYVAMSGADFAPYFRHADVVHRFGGSVIALAVTRAAHTAGKTVVISPFAHPGQWGEDKLSTAAYCEADHVVAANNLDKRTYTDLGVPEEQVGVCPPAVPPPRRTGGGDLRRLHGIEGPLVLFLGVRREYKGIDLLLQALPELTRRVPGVTLAILGPGPSLPADRPANALDVGEVSEEERDAWLDATALVALPSANESFGLAVSEAWAAGVPVVTSDIEVLRERVDACHGGLAVPRDAGALAEAMASLLLDDDRRGHLGGNGHAEWQRSLSPAAVANWHLGLYESLVAKRELTPLRGRHGVAGLRLNRRGSRPAGF